MKCEYLNKINAYYDKELNREDHKRIRDHLAGCNECQLELKELIKLNDFLGSYQEEELPDNFIDSIIKKTTGAEQISLRKIVNFPVAAMLIISFAIGIFVSNLTFSSSDDSIAEFGQDSYISLFEGGNDV